MRFLRKLYFELYIVFLAARFIGCQVLGSRVHYQGQVWFINNGTRPASWDLVSIGDPPRASAVAKRSECRLVRTPSNLMHGFFMMRRFYRQSWLDIWVRNGVEPWVRALRIWPKSTG